MQIANLNATNENLWTLIKIKIQQKQIQIPSKHFIIIAMKKVKNFNRNNKNLFINHISRWFALIMMNYIIKYYSLNLE